VAHRLAKLALAIGNKHIWEEDYPPPIHDCTCSYRASLGLSNKNLSLDFFFKQYIKSHKIQYRMGLYIPYYYYYYYYYY
jgi:hypothetical protein